MKIAEMKQDAGRKDCFGEMGNQFYDTDFDYDACADCGDFNVCSRITQIKQGKDTEICLSMVLDKVERLVETFVCPSCAGQKNESELTN
jgi:hypothetical protein